MPKLREVELGVEEDDLRGIPGSLPLCADLEVVILPASECSLSVATAIASITSLKVLSIGRVWQPGEWAGDPADRPLEDSWLQQATALCRIQVLAVCTQSKALPLVANLTGLTGLTWLRGDAEGPPYSIDPLTRLTKLRSLCIEDLLAERNVEIACSLGSGSLENLELSAWGKASYDCGRFLTRQTALARLTVKWELCNLRHVGALRIELLQSLRLVGLRYADAEGLSALRKATNLTSLDISIGLEEVPGADEEWEDEGADEEWEEVGPRELWLHTLRLSQALGRLTRLRALSLHSAYLQRVHFLDYTLAVRPLTGLTQLDIKGGGLEDGDLRALLGLTGLRVLDLSHCCLTNAVVPELSVLTNLKRLRLVSSGVTCEAPLTKVLNPLRRARGWPALECEVG